jgi:hypothetical protein
MTNSTNNLDDIPLPSGKNIKQCRQDSKRHKKKTSTPMSLSLDHILVQNGEYSSWQDFMIRAKSLFLMFSGKQTKAIDVAPQTLFLSSAGANMDNVLMNHWRKSLADNKSVCDIVIDVTGDSLKYATILSSLKKHFPERGFRLLNMMSVNEDNKLSYTNTFKKDKHQIEQLLGASKYTLDTMLSTQDSDEISNDEKIKLLSEPNRYNLFSFLEREAGDGFSLSEMFSTKNTTAVLFPSLAKSSDIVYNIFFDLLELIKKEQSLSNIPVRITLSGLPRGTTIPPHLVEWLFNSDNVQIIAHCYYPSAQQDNWLNDAIGFSSQSFLSFADSEKDVPNTLKTLTSMLTGMNRNNNDLLPALELAKGCLIAPCVKLGFSPMPLLKKIDIPRHKNGSKLTK